MYGNTVFVLSAMFAVIVYVQHELGGSSWWLTRETSFCIQCVVLELAATLVASTRPELALGSQTVQGVLLSAFAFGTTIFGQDYKDVEGDKLIGRRTVAIVFPQNVTRPLLMVLLIGWSAVLATYWELGQFATIAYVTLATAVGLRYVLIRGCRADQVSYYLYNVRPQFICIQRC
jgi:1,4-dihydroxy-2-naphthoate octaprenyltransferase